MKKKFLAFIVPVMMMTSLTGCNNGKYNKFCEAAADAAPLLLNSQTGKEIYASENAVRHLADYNSVLALSTYTFQQKELTITWEVAPKEKWVVSSYGADETRSKITPVYSAEEFDGSIKCTVSYLEKGKSQGKAEMSWKFHVESTETIEMTLEALNKKYVENDNKLGDLAKDEEGKDVVIGTRGYISATYEDPDHVYAGVFIQDGEYSLQLYAGSLSSLWTENNLKIGDCVFVVGTLSIYGVIEMKSSLLEKIDGDAYGIKAPVTVDVTDKTWDVSLMANQSSLVVLNNCSYVSGKIDKLTAHTTIKFKHGEDSVEVYCSYHLGETMMQALKDLFAEYTTETTVSIKGILTFNSTTPQIIPVFGVESFVAAQ